MKIVYFRGHGGGEEQFYRFGRGPKRTLKIEEKEVKT